jgi:2-dehydropantoate 2-reductase
MRVVIFGAGAVGGLFGALLSQARHEVLLVAREPEVVAIRTHGLRIEGETEGNFSLPAVDSLTDGLETEAVLLTVKTPDLGAAAREIALHLRPPPPILLLQNGLGVEAGVERAWQATGRSLPAGTLVRAVHSVPVTRLGPARLRHAGNGEVLLGTSDRTEDQIAIGKFRDLLASAGLTVRVVPSIDREVWRKVVLNAAINPVTADHGILNGALATDPYRGEAESLLAEAAAVARSEGFAFDTDEIERDLWRIVRATARNRSSMLQDLDQGRPTEIDAIVGELLRRGEAGGLALPHLRRAQDRIRARVDRAPPHRPAPGPT